MTRTDWMSIAMVMLVIALPTHGQEVPISASASNVEATSLTIDLPTCKRDMKAWKAFSPWAYLRKEGDSEATVARLTRHWKREDAVDVTWVDIDGDGWCDAITSGDIEPYKNAKGKPVLLFEPRAIFLRTSQGFKPFQENMITGDYEGSSFTVYWDTESHSAAIYSRIWQGNLIAGLGPGDDAFHFRQMMRASFAAHKAGNVDEESQYATEVEPFLYTSRYLPRAVVKRIWAEEAQRAGVDLAFPYAD